MVGLLDRILNGSSGTGGLLGYAASPQGVGMAQGLLTGNGNFASNVGTGLGLGQANALNQAKIDSTKAKGVGGKSSLGKLQEDYNNGLINKATYDAGVQYSLTKVNGLGDMVTIPLSSNQPSSNAFNSRLPSQQVKPVAPVNIGGSLPVDTQNDPTMEGGAPVVDFGDNQSMGETTAPPTQGLLNQPQQAYGPQLPPLSPTALNSTYAQKGQIDNAVKAAAIPAELALEKGKSQIVPAVGPIPSGYKSLLDENGNAIGLQRLDGTPVTTIENDQNKVKQARASVTGILTDVANNYNKLDKEAGIINIDKSAANNLYRGLASTDANQFLQQQRGSPESSTRKKIYNAQPILINAIRKASEMGAKGMDSNTELQFYLAAASDPKSDLQSNLAALKALNDAYGLGANIDIDQKYVDKLKNDFNKSSNPSSGGQFEGFSIVK